MIDKDQLREFIREVLRDLDRDTNGLIKHNLKAVELIMMTWAHESKLGTYIKQIKGPALGPGQMEPDTFDDIMENFVEYREDLKKVMEGRKSEELKWDLRLAIIMTRVHYFRVPEKLPGTPREMAEYAKKHYNTYEGKALVQDYLDAYLDFC